MGSLAYTLVFITDCLKPPQILRISLEGGLHVVPIFTGEVPSELAAWEGYSAPDVWLVLRRGGRTRLGQRPPLLLGVLSPPRLLGTAVLPAVSGLGIAFHTDAGPRCRPAALCVVTQSATQVPPETAVECRRFIVKKVATEN